MAEGFGKEEVEVDRVDVEVRYVDANKTRRQVRRTKRGGGGTRDMQSREGRGGERGRARRAWVSACSRGGLGPQLHPRRVSIMPQLENGGERGGRGLVHVRAEGWGLSVASAPRQKIMLQQLALHLRDHQQPRRNKEVSCHPSRSLQKTTTQLTNNLKSKLTRLPPTHTQHRQNTHPHKSKHKPTTRGSASRFAHPGMSVAPLRVIVAPPSPSQPTPTLDPTPITNTIAVTVGPTLTHTSRTQPTTKTSFSVNTRPSFADKHPPPTPRLGHARGSATM